MSTQKGAIRKNCALCQKHGGVHTTYTTGECRKYNNNGTLQKSFGGKAADGKKRHGSSKKESANSFLQVMESFSKLKKLLKKSQKSTHKRKRRYESSDTSDSDSE